VRIEIDQSGKIEYTNKPTVVAYSNGIVKSILIRSQDKKKIEKLFRLIGSPDMFIYKTFALLIFLLIKNDLEKIRQVVIDVEYTGKDNLIKTFIKRLAIKSGKDFDVSKIHFVRVGKKSRSHIRAIGVYRGQLKPDLVVKFEDLKVYLF